jgi:hypothetical protein
MNEDCKNLINDSWNAPIVGCPMYVLSQKLKRLKLALKDWNKNVFGDIHVKVTEAEAHLNEIQMQIDTDGANDSLMNLQKNAQIKYDEALNMQEVFWKKKTRVQWHTDGDRNTGYFHRLAKIKNTNKLITSIRAGDVTLHEPNEIAEHITNHFKNLFSSNSFLQVNSLVEDVIPRMITDQANNMLTTLPSMEEVKNAVFPLNKEGAPGPDGFGAYFFQTYWSIIHLDVFNAVT